MAKLVKKKKKLRLEGLAAVLLFFRLSLLCFFFIILKNLQ